MLLAMLYSQARLVGERDLVTSSECVTQGQYTGEESEAVIFSNDIP